MTSFYLKVSLLKLKRVYGRDITNQKEKLNAKIQIKCYRVKGKIYNYKFKVYSDPPFIAKLLA